MLIQLERQRLRLAERLHGGRDYLDLPSGQRQVLVALRTPGYLTDDLDARLRAQPVCGRNVTYDDLRHSGSITQVHERHSPVIAAPRDPPGQRYGLASVFSPEFTGRMRAKHKGPFRRFSQVVEASSRFYATRLTEAEPTGQTRDGSVVSLIGESSVRRHGGREGSWLKGVAMLMPALSVTAIGIIVGVAAIVARKQPKTALVRTIVGAWLGFVAGAVPGIIADVMSGSGVYVAVLGHAGAAVGAVMAVARRTVTPAPSREA
jgi:hypothetical protein